MFDQCHPGILLLVLLLSCTLCTPRPWTAVDDGPVGELKLQNPPQEDTWGGLDSLAARTAVQSKKYDISLAIASVPVRGQQCDPNILLT